MKIVFLSLSQVKEIHDELIGLHGGMPGIRDCGLLESAMGLPMQTFEGRLLHPTIFLMAAAYCFSLIKNHAFNDGNKRTAAMSVYVFLSMNGYSLEVEEDELVDFAVRIAEGKLPKDLIAKFLEERSIKLSAQE